LDDLKYRLEHTRWPDQAKDAGWTMGPNLDYMKDLTNFWLQKYDWRKNEMELNKFRQFTAVIDGVKLHFIHEPSSNPEAIPVLLVHGWPDSFYRFHKVIPMLTDKYHVVVPSMPGVAFSERTALPIDKIAELFAKLMTEELGYKKFISAGGDGGSLVSLSLAQRNPDVLLGIHLTDVGYPDYSTDIASLTPPEQEFAGFIQNWWVKEGAFSMVNASKPQSAAYAFNDSPVGLAAWIISMMSALTTGEDLNKRFGLDELLTNIMIYWLTETIGSSMRISFVESQTAYSKTPFVKSEVPAGVAHCPWDAPLPREWAARKTNLIHFADLEKGGHFAAWEAPDTWVQDFREFAQKLNK
jgi:pimeloyl-ACP methyl ester carboxylesterase